MHDDGCSCRVSDEPPEGGQVWAIEDDRLDLARIRECLEDAQEHIDGAYLAVQDADSRSLEEGQLAADVCDLNRLLSRTLRKLEIAEQAEEAIQRGLRRGTP